MQFIQDLFRPFMIPSVEEIEWKYFNPYRSSDTQSLKISLNYVPNSSYFQPTQISDKQHVFKHDQIKKDQIKKDQIKKDQIKKDQIKKDQIKKNQIKKDQIKNTNVENTLPNSGDISIYKMEAVKPVGNDVSVCVYFNKNITEYSCIHDVKLDSNFDSNIDSSVYSNVKCVSLVYFDSNIDSNVDSNFDSNIDSNVDSNFDSNIDSNVDSNFDSNIDSNVDSNFDSNTDSDVHCNVDSNVERRNSNLKFNSCMFGDANCNPNFDSYVNFYFNYLSADISTARNLNIKINCYFAVPRVKLK
jgi:pentapeptide MXKDX repeat protein